MNTALFGPQKYTGEFVTLHYQENRGWQVTLWQFGQPIRYTVHEQIIPALSEILTAGAMWASEQMKTLFEQDVVMAGVKMKATKTWKIGEWVYYCQIPGTGKVVNYSFPWYLPGHIMYEIEFQGKTYLAYDYELD